MQSESTTVVSIPLFARDNVTIRAYALVDAEDAERVRQHRWRYVPRRREGYAVCRLRNNGVSRKIYLHRFLLGSPPSIDIDHRDGKGLNNQKANLREATQAQNTSNQNIRRSNTSGHKGVSFERHAAKYSARIMHEGRRIRLGLFLTAKDAARAYNAAALQLHGEYALLNQVD